ncbi:type II secretion system protein [Shewanella cyperi]|uniref:Type II secretion system protein n=1 Tax=Shewanella cyperi TaxID=2814292 RepID=A0A974XLX9_9GAMM|nr:type II secretion system protein [Shewanella cyperi]QSX29678.1 type II secretion system protein [Shewanella cyperi]
MRQFKSSLGFTLVEMVTVIIILGVLVVGVSSFIIFGTRIFVESSAVDQVMAESRFALERMTRDVRQSLPGSLRLASGSDGSRSWQCLELVPVVSSSSYIVLPVFPDSVATTGTALLDSGSSRVASGQWLFVYPLTADEVYQAAAGDTGRRVALQDVSVSANELNLTFASAFRFVEASPRQRVYFATTALSYCFIQTLASGDISLWHYSNYSLLATQASPADMLSQGATESLMAQHITTASPLSLYGATLLNNAMVQLDLGFNVNGQVFSYQHQMQVINVP